MHVCVIFCYLKGRSMLLRSFLQVLIAFVQPYQANNGCKNCQSYNKIMPGSGPTPACMQKWLSGSGLTGNRKFIWSGLNNCSIRVSKVKTGF